MSKLALYQYNPRQIIIPDAKEAYFIRDLEVYRNNLNDHHNPEWYIQAKIRDNEDGYFDFSKNMIDIGACYGTYTWVLPFQHSYMFEPNKEYFAYINANALLHERINSVSLYNVAVSNSNGLIGFDGFVSGDLANPDGNLWTNTKYEQVQCVTLNSIKEQLSNIGFIKIDIEGHEPYALLGMMEVIKENDYPPILFESWPEGVGLESPEQRFDRVELLNNIFDDLGYVILWNWGDEENHLAVHKSRV